MTDSKAPKKKTAEEASNQVGLVLAMGMTSSEEISDLMNAMNRYEEVIYNDALPVNITCDGVYDAKAILEAAGIKFHDVVPNDRLFQYVDLPEGWRKTGTPNSLWSWLLDDKGRKRAAIFYDSSLCNRDARMRLYTRFMVVKDDQKDSKENLIVANVTDGDRIIYSTKEVAMPLLGGGRQYDAIEVAKEAASKWLDANYPDWRNPGAYWD